MSAKIISVVSQKGGVTKSTTCINLGVGLARHGKRVLLVDNDPQGSMTISLGFQHPEKIAIKTNDMLSKIILKLPIEPGEGILRNAEGVDLMPSGIELAAMEMNMTDEKERETIMKRYLETVRFMYDFIIIDCMPSLSLLTINALAAADYLLIPTQTQFLSAKGIEQIMDTVQKVRRSINPDLRVAGILLTMVDHNSNFTRDVIAALHESYEGLIRFFYSQIPRSVRAAEASAAGKSIYAYDPKGRVAAAYSGLTREVMRIVQPGPTESSAPA